MAEAVIATIGDELLCGEIRNTNAPWLARELEKLGIATTIMATLPDERAPIAAFVGWARRSHDVVIVTGGLGGTPDDVTRAAIADALAVGCVVQSELMDELTRSGGYSAVFAREWSLLPTGSRLIASAPGAAPAFAVRNVYALPGVPAEMRAAFRSLRRELPVGSPRETWRRTYAATEDRLASLLGDLDKRFPSVSVGSYPRYGRAGPEVELVIRASAPGGLAAAVSHVELALAAARVAPRREA
jgi:molybdenum cofactor synthesis domain-containing protein